VDGCGFERLGLHLSLLSKMSLTTSGMDADWPMDARRSMLLCMRRSVLVWLAWALSPVLKPVTKSSRHVLPVPGGTGRR
jgi:hypothetical protein